MTFETYARTSGRNVGVNPEPVVSLRRSGTLAFSRGAQRLLGISERKEIMLLFDRATGQIGVRSCRPGDGSSTRLTLTTNSKPTPNAALQVSVVGFCKQFGVDPERAHGMYPLCADERSGLAIVQLPAGSWERAMDITPIRERLNGKRGLV